jgi:hypothetical protein
MDFTDESYVRLYTRDTKTWLRLGWQGQALLCLLLRKVDRAGVIDGLEDPIDDIALVTGLPSEIVTVGLERLLAQGVFSLDAGRLVMRRFVEAQNCRQTDRLRKAESRARRAAGVTFCDEMSPTVTQSHQRSQLVTPILAQSNLTKTNRRDLPNPPKLLDTPEQEGSDGPTLQPEDADCGALEPRGCADGTSDVVSPVWRSLRGWQEPPGWDLELAAAGVSRAVFNKRFAELLVKPIGGRDGVTDRTGYLRLLLPKWRMWEETERLKTAKPAKAELQEGGAWFPSVHLRRFALGKCGFSEQDFERLSQVYAQSEDWYGRSKAEADKRFAQRVGEAARTRDVTLQLLRAREGPQQ